MAGREARHANTLTMADYLVREATLDDAQLIADLTCACWAGRVAESSSGHGESAKLVSAHLRQGGGLVLECGGEAIGSVRWTPLDADESVWEILRMGVLPRFSGQRLSQQLLERVVDLAHTAHIDELRLAVRIEQTRLLDVYAAQGFEAAPELEYSHANPTEPAPIVMRRRLRRSRESLSR